jgi:PAS domain-containing protein
MSKIEVIMENNINTKQRNAIEKLQNMMAVKFTKGLDDAGLYELDEALWQVVVAYQNYKFYTKSGLMFSYVVKYKRNGEYSGELVVSRKEESKTLTKSSIMLAFHKVLSDMKDTTPPEYKGPKAIGQIFGISYIYSLFLEIGLIRVPKKAEQKEGEITIMNEYADFFKSIIDQDRCAIVICNLEHKIIYMNPQAKKYYAKGGGEKLIGQSIMDCHNEESQAKISQVVEWFAASEDNNIVYTFHNEKQNKDVYMVALRSQGKLIGYYEKHEFRNRETMPMYIP